MTEDKFRKVNVCLPMSGDRVTGQGLSAGVAGNDRERERLKGGRPQFEMDGPFLKIRHVLKIRVVCQTGDLSDPQQTVSLPSPLSFIRSYGFEVLSAKGIATGRRALNAYQIRVLSSNVSPGAEKDCPTIL